MKIVYYSNSGNTKAMAEYIKEGIEKAGKQAELIDAETIQAAALANEDILILGCPACGSEELDDTTMEPLIDSLASNMAGKKLALFGSYGWGGGEWMDHWQDKMTSLGSVLISDGLIVNDTPEGDDIERCIAFGETIANH